MMEFTTVDRLKGQISDDINNGILHNVAIFIDYDNIYYSMKDYGVKIFSGQLPEQFPPLLIKHDPVEHDVCKILGEIYDINIVRKFRAYADFQQLQDVNLTQLQEQRVQIRHVYGNSKEEKYRKNASDIELSLDAIETYYKNTNIDTFVFVTCDSDMIPIMGRLKYKGKRVHLYYIGGNISQSQHINTYADISCDLIKLLTIDEQRNSIEFWIDKAKEVFDSWCSSPKNQSKFYGLTWFNNDLCRNLYISNNLAGQIIQYLIENDAEIANRCAKTKTV